MATENTATIAAEQDANMLDPGVQGQALLSFVESVVKDDLLASLITAVLIVIVTAIITHLLTNFLRGLLSRDNSPLPQSSIFINIGRVVMWFIGLSVMLSTCFGVNVTAAVTALGIGGLAISLGFQDTVSNLIGGLQLSIMSIVEPGDHIEMAGVRGVVKDVTWRQVTLETPTGGLVIIPNQIINKNTFTHLPDVEKIVVPINVSKDVCDLSLFTRCVQEAVDYSVQRVASLHKPSKVLFDSTTEFGYSGNVILWMSEDDDVLQVKDAVVRAIAPFSAKDFAQPGSAPEALAVLASIVGGESRGTAEAGNDADAGEADASGPKAS